MYKKAIKIGLILISLVSLGMLLYPKMNVPYIPVQSLDNRVVVGKFLPKDYFTSGQQVAVVGDVESGNLKRYNKILINNKEYPIKEVVQNLQGVAIIIESINKDEINKYIENKVGLPIIE